MSYITDDVNYRTSINLYVNDKEKHYLKYISFLDKNPDLPFTIKKKVDVACIFSSIMYGCETWFTSDYKKLDTLYMGIIKALLSEKKTTCNDLCLIESGIPSLKAAIQDKQYRYLKVLLCTLHYSW